MKFAIAVHGTRGDVEPAAAVARELLRRGHEVGMAVPPNLVEFVNSLKLPLVVSYGPDSHRQLESDVFRYWWKLRSPVKVLSQLREYVMDSWTEMSETLRILSANADLVICGTTYQELAANVAEARSIPLAALHYFPVRANNQILPFRIPPVILKTAWTAAEWLHWRLLKPAYDEQRRTLGLPESKIRAVRRIVEQGALEIQAYDPLFFPDLERQWHGKRPLVGSLTLELATASDHDVMSWIKADKPPIYFGLGSMPIDDPSKAIAMVVKVCKALGERVLICTGELALQDVIADEDVKIVLSVNHSAVFPLCRAIVHHGGAGTTAASVRSGIPTLILWVGAEQPIWGSRIKHLGVGTSHRFSSTTSESLMNDLRTTMGPRCTQRAREVATHMTPAIKSLTDTVDFLEIHAMRHTPH